MFHMLSSFNLRPNTTEHEFRRSVDEFTKHLQEIDLVRATGPVGRRQRHPVMDTDSESDHDYYFIMSFEDRDQCDRAVEYISQHTKQADTIHESVYASIQDAVFTCWEDI